MRDEPLKMNDKVRVTELVAESDIETRLLYEMALVRLRESDLDFGAGMDRKQHEGGPSFGLLRDGAKAFGWVTPIQHEDGFLDIVIELGGAYYWAHGFARHPNAAVLSKDVEVASKKVALDRLKLLAGRWNKQCGDPVFELGGFGGKSVRLTHPKHGSPVEITYLDLNDPEQIIAEGWEEKLVIRSPRTNPYITARTSRCRIKARDFPSNGIWKLVAILRVRVESVEADNAPD